jgi:hypothetical protein
MFEYVLAIVKKPEAFAQLLAAIIGVSGLALTFIVTFFKTKSFQKSEKIAEARLSIYLELVEMYSAFIIYIHMNKDKLSSDQFQNTSQENLVKLVSSYNKACIVCGSETKKTFNREFNKMMDLYSEILTYGLQENEILKKIVKLEKTATELSLLMREELDVIDNIKIEKKIINENYIDPNN